MARLPVYSAPAIRNVAFAGHAGVGKTSLVSAALFVAGATPRLGKVDDGTAATDFDAEEVARRISIGNGIAVAEWSKNKINIVDAPGYGIFATEMRSALAAVESAVLVVDAVAGLEVGTERAWKVAADLGLPRIIVVNRMDRENANFEKVVDSLQARLDRHCVPIQLPVGKEKDFHSVVDLVAMKLVTWDAAGKASSAPIPDHLAADAKAWHEKLIEAVAEGDDTLMARYFEQGGLSEEEVHEGLQRESRAHSLFPILATVAPTMVGVSLLLDEIVDLLPSPDEIPSRALTLDGSERTWTADENAPPGAFVFKTISDPFAGRISVLRVYSGKWTGDHSYKNLTRDSDERFGPLFALQGKEHLTLDEARAGDIIAVAKLKETRTGDTIGGKELPVRFPPVKVPESAIAFAIAAKTRGDEDKIGTALHKLIDEDPTLHFELDETTKEFHLTGAGQLHVEIAVARLKKRYGVEVILHPPKVPYRETIKRKADGHGRHKKQTGGHGQFADCRITFEPLPRGSNFEFVDEVFGGAIPRNYIPAVEKGLQETRVRGYLAGFPMLDFRARLTDGQYHDVDSSEMAFKIAASLAFKDALQNAAPTLLEPIMSVEIRCPQDYLGDIMGDLNQRRGRVQGMDTESDVQVIKAMVPMAEMLTYEQTLIGATQGRGSFHMEVDHYDEVPRPLQEKIIEKAKMERERRGEAHAEV